MKRRSFLAMLGLAPAAAALSVIESTASEKPSITAPFDFKDGDLRVQNAAMGRIRFEKLGGRMVMTVDGKEALGFHDCVISTVRDATRRRLL